MSLLKNLLAGTRAGFVASVLLACGPLLAQSTGNSSGSAPQPSSPAPQSQSTQQAGANPLHAGVGIVQVLDRKSVFFPDIATSAGRLSPWQKFQLAANNSVALSAIASSLVAAGYGQAINRPAGYGQGGEGYAKRFGAEMGREASFNMFGNFVISSVTHEDPRFYVKKDLSLGQAIEYSAVRVVVTNSDSGGRTINLGGLLGFLGSEALANTYYPKGSRDVGDMLVRYGSDQGWRFGANMLRQYWPKINRKLHLVPSNTSNR